MDVAVLLLFAVFFTALLVRTTSRYDVLRASVGRPRLFQIAAVLAAAVTVPVDVYAVVYGTVGPGAVALEDVAGRLLLMNVAAACGVAALHGSLRGRALAGPGTAAAVAGSAPPMGAPADDGHALRLGVLGWTGPLIALIVVTAVVAVGSGGDGMGSGGNGSGAGSVGPTTGSVGSALAVYSLLVCVISASSLFRRRARSAIDPQEG
ncbi:hypothetical protein E0H75_13760 [Kribbella capetownensis]|uniref:Uncharacterized protein n=1 Tax=Kribbella capetownensis TaxID=1572659 RepID=A0A4R0K7V8_9ACTN|nr:hypothetical protein [Kribbella capetownensis]TCC51185.1 hypothetical protein E0H75_13760 [Kribbella capetownensis]